MMALLDNDPATGNDRLRLQPVTQPEPTPDATAASPLETARRLIATPSMAAMSFDIFDTFLLRRCTAPDGVYERAFHNLPVAARRFGLAESFVQHRVLAEHRARLALAEKTQTGEVTIDEIYRHFPRHVFDLADLSIEDLVEAEFQAELDLCRANPEILALLQAAQARDLKTGFISDTYWPAARLRMLLEHAAPGLRYDFLYASCEYRTGKVATLLKIYLERENLAGDTAIHIGDNYLADILGARAFGMQAVHYPQPHEKIMPLILRESLAAQLLRSKRADFSHRLDGGLMTVRRTALGRMPRYEEMALTAAAVLGPVAAGFQHFIEQRLARIAKDGRRAAVLFLGRDGFLPMAVWNQCSSIPAHYIEINRRVALVGSLHQLEPLQDIFRACMMVNAPTVDAFFKTAVPSIHDYFARQPNGMVRGRVLAAELPNLLTDADIADLSRGMRAQILDHFRLHVPGFDELTDLVLVDLGYSGTIQKCLRGIFDQEGLPHRLHGVYMLSVDEALTEIADGDSAAGLIDDSIVTPIIKRFLLRNIALLEQLCSSPVGSVSLYKGGVVQREEETRPTEQLEFCTRIQQACLDFVQLFRNARDELAIDPAEDMVTMRSWSAVLLTRLLLLPSLEEQSAFGAIRHDVNLGTHVLHDLINTEITESLLGAMPMATVWQADAPPMWTGGNMAAISGLAGCAYGVAAFGLPVQELLKEHIVAHLPVCILKDGKGESCGASCAATATGDLRLRIPIRQSDSRSLLAIPLETFLQRGLIRSITVQQGQRGIDASYSQQIGHIPQESVQGLACHVAGQEFCATGPDAHLLVPVEGSARAITIVTLTVTPLPPLSSNLAVAQAGAPTPARGLA